MPSTHKTAHLTLNKWLGTDKPKKDDFNADNERIDAACRTMAQNIAALEQADAGTAQSITGLGARCDSLGGAINTHAADTAAHVTAAEKALWNSGGSMVMDTYVGTGGTTRQVTMGFRPRYGVLYAVDRSPVQADWNQDVTDIFFGFFSEKGSSKYIAITADGITVSHHHTVPANGCSLLYNESGVTYVYMAWK